MGRGRLSEDVQVAAAAKLGREITKTELRLMPYVQYCLMNDQNIEPTRINQSEREVLTQWRIDGWISGGAAELVCTKEFWDAMNHVLWYGYVNY